MDPLSRTGPTLGRQPGAEDIVYLKSFLPAMLFWQAYNEKLETKAEALKPQVAQLRDRLPAGYAPPEGPVQLLNALEVMLATLAAAADGQLHLGAPASAPPVPAAVAAPERADPASAAWRLAESPRAEAEWMPSPRRVEPVAQVPPADAAWQLADEAPSGPRSRSGPDCGPSSSRVGAEPGWAKAEQEAWTEAGLLDSREQAPGRLAQAGLDHCAEAAPARPVTPGTPRARREVLEDLSQRVAQVAGLAGKEGAEPAPTAAFGAIAGKIQDIHEPLFACAEKADKLSSTNGSVSKGSASEKGQPVSEPEPATPASRVC